MALLGFFPIEFGLNVNSLNFEAEVIQVLLESFSFSIKETYLVIEESARGRGKVSGSSSLEF